MNKEILTDISQIMKAYEGMTYEESVDHQVRYWSIGMPTHNPVGDECCQDFSCCNPSLLMSESGRKRFVEAHFSGDDKLRSSMLMMCLGSLVDKSEIKVHIAGDECNSSTH